MTSINDDNNHFPLIILIIGSLSIFLSLIIILMYFFNKNLRGFATKMIACICFSDILFTLGIICNQKYIDIVSNRFICNLSAFLTLFGSLSSLSWGSIIAYTVYINTVNPGNKIVLQKTKRMVKKYALIFSYIIPFLFAVVPLFFEDYRNVGDVCFITLDTTSGYFSNIALDLLPLLIEIIVIFFYIFKSIKAQQKEYQQSSKYLLVYPMICVIAFGSFFCQKSYELITGLSCGCDYDWHSISFILCALNGGLNAICYGLNSSICFPLFNLVPCCCKERSDSSHTNQYTIQTSLRADSGGHMDSNQFSTPTDSRDNNFMFYMKHEIMSQHINTSG
ncbi:hypothetical protein ABPG72_022053 [Tetrahymena utriculariae]